MAAACLVLAISVPVAFGHGRTISTNKGVVRWQDNTTITVYIPADPQGQGRDVSLGAGILKWNDVQTLKDRGIKFKIESGTPPANAQNAVTVLWEAPANGTDLGETDTKGSVGKSGNTLTGATLRISPDQTQVTKNMATNLGLHEGGHILGLIDDNTAGAAMNPEFSATDTLTIKSADTKEVDAVYSANKAGAQASVVPSVTQVGSLFTYAYDVTWLNGGPLEVFQVDTNGAPLLSVSSLWPLDTFPQSTDNIFTGILDPGFSAPSFISFVGPDTLALDASNPQIDFSFTTDRAPSSGQYFLNGLDFTQTPSAIPEPQNGVMLLTGIMSLVAVRRLIARRQVLRVAS